MLLDGVHLWLHTLGVLSPPPSVDGCWLGVRGCEGTPCGCPHLQLTPQMLAGCHWCRGCLSRSVGTRLGVRQGQPCPQGHTHPPLHPSVPSAGSLPLAPRTETGTYFNFTLLFS